MASSVSFTPMNQPLAAFRTHECAYCQSPISAGERWVREKVLEPFRSEAARYRRYHADLFGEEVLSCWEKHQMQQDTQKTKSPA